MKHFTVCDTKGRILRSGFTSDDGISTQASGPDERVIEGLSDDRIHKVVRKKIVKMLEGEIKKGEEKRSQEIERMKKADKKKRAKNAPR